MAEPRGPAEDEMPPDDLKQEQMVRYAEDLRRARRAQRALTGRIRGVAQERVRVLIVDDEKDIRLLVAATLGAEEYEITEATRGTEALTLARAKLPSLIILDVRMPDLDGVEVCRLIRSDPELKNVPIIMVTSARNAEERRAGLEAGANRYLTKPFSPAELLGAVDYLLKAI